MTTTWRSFRYHLNFLLIAGVLMGCFQSDYTRMVKAELAKGVREDSILLGIRFGDTRDIFYGKCFDLNRAKLVAQGPGNKSVQYMFTDSLVHEQPTPVRLLFSPSYDRDDKIAQMKLEFSYPGWSPWNKQYFADSLERRVERLLMNWYGGNEFVIANVNDSTSMPVKVDGNRRILVRIMDEQTVAVSVQDILHPSFRHSISED